MKQHAPFCSLPQLVAVYSITNNIMTANTLTQMYKAAFSNAAANPFW